MRQFIHGICIEKKNSPVYRSRLIHAFAKEYDLTSDRLWNCLRVRPLCREFSEVESSQPCFLKRLCRTHPAFRWQRCPRMCNPHNKVFIYSQTRCQRKL